MRGHELLGQRIIWPIAAGAGCTARPFMQRASTAAEYPLSQQTNVHCQSSICNQSWTDCPNASSLNSLGECQCNLHTLDEQRPVCCCNLPGVMQAVTPLPGMEVRRLPSAMRRCSLRRLPTSADRLDSLLPDTRSSLRLVSAPMPAWQTRGTPPQHPGTGLAPSPCLPSSSIACMRPCIAWLAEADMCTALAVAVPMSHLAWGFRRCGSYLQAGSPAGSWRG